MLVGVFRHRRIVLLAWLVAVVEGGQPTPSTRQAYDLEAKGFGPGFSGPFTVAGEIHPPGDVKSFDHVLDVASHQGAPQMGRPGATVGVAASGVDRVYPARHRALWEQVVALGTVISETPPGRPAQTWRFPARNRIIAGLVSMVVVVEPHAAGGSLITADAAIERGIEVRAVPGPV